MKRALKCLLSLLLAIGLLICPVSAWTYKTQGTATHTRPSRAIAVVFDNSGSMYGEDAWCQATYAMEVFASMMNDGDTLQIYPMNPMKLDGRYYDMSSPLTLNGGEDTSCIQRIVSQGGGTPISSVQAAQNGLAKLSGDEKWLVVLTDGSFDVSFEESDRIVNGTSDQFNLLFLGIGEWAYAPTLTPVQGKTRMADCAVASDEITEKLTAMCNAIFGRDVLPENHFDGKNLDFDLDMTKLIVFVQGSDIENVALKDENGKMLQSVGQIYSPHYSEVGDYWNASLIADDLTGCIITYEDVSAGNYTLSYSGTPSSVEVYYEPEVVLQVALVSPDGVEVQGDSLYPPGTYTLHYALTTPEGEDVDSDLLGQLDYQITTIIDGTENTVSTGEQGSLEVDLKAGQVLDFAVDAHYLTDYHIHVESGELDWFPSGGLQIPDSEDFALELNVPQRYYQLSKINSSKPLVVELTVNGTSMTATQMNSLVLTVDGEGLVLNQVSNPADGTVTLSIDPGAAKNGSYRITVQGIYTDAYGSSCVDEDEANIKIGLYPWWLPWLIVLLGLLLIAVLIWLFLRQKVLPKKISVNMESCAFSAGRVSFDQPVLQVRYLRSGKKGTLVLTSPENAEASCSITVHFEASSPRYVRSSRRDVLVTDVAVSPTQRASAMVGGCDYAMEEGCLVADPPGATVYLRSGSECSMNAQYLDMRGRRRTLMLSAQLVFL